MLWAVGLCAVLLWPIARGGYLLGHDMVFTPRQPLNLASIGVSSAPPRAVPLDALVALAEHIVTGAVVGRFAVIVPVLAAGAGAAALLRRGTMAGRLAACGFAIWNPYVVERLALGQWALLWSYAALPWLVLAVGRARTARGWLAVGLLLAAASITPTGGIVAAVVVVVAAVGARRGRGAIGMATALALTAQLPWVAPALVSTAAATSDPRGVAAFAARPEFSGGTVLSLLGGGGIWNADVVPNSRSGPLPWLGLAVLTLAAGYGVRRLTKVLGTSLAATLGAVAALGAVVAAAASVPGLDAAVRTIVQHVPGAGLLRDAQKWVLPLVLFEALLVGAAVDRLGDRIRAANWRAVLAIAALAAPLLLLPDGAVPVHDTMRPVHYPSDWAAVVAKADDGTATVVPFASYRRFPWAPGRNSVLDPAPRQLKIDTVVQDRLSVSGQLLGGEDERAAAVGRALNDPTVLASRLAALGIQWVVVERDTPGTVPSLAGLVRTYSGTSLALYRVPGPVADVHAAAWRVVTVLIGDLVTIVVLLVLAGIAVHTSRRRRTAALL
jgi:hypothetical protein